MEQRSLDRPARIYTEVTISVTETQAVLTVVAIDCSVACFQLQIFYHRNCRRNALNVEQTLFRNWNNWPCFFYSSSYNKNHYRLDNRSTKHYFEIGTVIGHVFLGQLKR